MTLISDAIYQPHPLPQFNGNPLSESIQSLNDYQLLLNARCEMTFEGDFWALDDTYQRTLLQGLSNIHIPCARFTMFYKKCFSLLLNRYASSNPFEPTSMAQKMSIAFHFDAKHKQPAPVFTSATAPSVLVTGPSGSGKTTLIRNVLLSFPQAIQHTEYQGKMYQQIQVVWLSIDMPTTPSIKALALNFFRALDSATCCTRYFEEWQKRSRDSVEQHIAGIQLAAATHEVGLVHIDELQFLLGYSKSVNAPNLSILDGVFNQIGIPLIISCTDIGLTLFNQSEKVGDKIRPEFTTLRRLVNDRQFQLTPYSINGSEFRSTLDALYPRFSLLNCSKLSEEFIMEFHKLTAGLASFMTRLARIHHEFLLFLYHQRPKDTSLSTSDIKWLRDVHKNQFPLFIPALKYLRAGLIYDYEQAISNTNEEQALQVNKNSSSINKKTKSKNSVIAPAPDATNVIEDAVSTPFLRGIKD